MNKKISTPVAFTIIIVLAVIAVAGIFFCKYQWPNDQAQYVAPTPTPTPDETIGWQTYKNNDYKFEFKYPQSFGANVWNTLFWPPKTVVVLTTQDPAKVGCPDLSLDIALPVQNVTLNNVVFSYYTSSDAGAGSLYSTYCYITQKDQKYYVLEFVIRSHTGCYQGGCGAYCETQYEQECRNFDLKRDVESKIQKMVSTFNFTN